MDYETLTDRELAIAAGNGDERGLATLYDRYFQGVYDFAVRTLRDLDAAADVVQRTFAAASRDLAARTVPENVKVWLFSIAIREATARTRQAPPPPSSGPQQIPSLIEIDPARTPDPEPLQRDRELRELVWQSAAELSPREYALLDLHLRRGLDAGELAAVVGIGGDSADAAVSAAGESFERSAVSSLLVRRGRQGCPELAALLERAGAQAAPADVRQAVLAHAQACPRCQATRADHVSPVQVFAGYADIPAAAGLKEVIWSAAAVAAVPAAGVAAAPAKRRRPLLTALLIVAALVAVAVALSLIFADGGDEALGDPDDIRSPSHEVGEPSTETVVQLVWSRQEGVLSYSLAWSIDKFELPDEVGDLSGEATDATSPELTPGDWYFHLRTQREDGTWTSTVHVGPFEIVAGPTPTAEPTEEPSPTPAPQPTPTEEPPTPEPTPEPDATTPEPTDTPTEGVGAFS